MKKIFTLSTGIVFLITILIAGGCDPSKGHKATNTQENNKNVANDGTKRVIIYIRSIRQDGVIHLTMFDSNGKIAIDSLITDVQPGGTVIWKLERASGIKNIDKIYATTGEHNIFKKDPAKRFLSKGYKLKVPDDAKEGEEEYAIDYILENNTKVTIDPYLRIPPVD
jgi:hypothetical protein